MTTTVAVCSKKFTSIAEVNFIIPWRPSCRFTELFEFGLHRTGTEKVDLLPIEIGLCYCIEVVWRFRKIAKSCS